MSVAAAASSRHEDSQAFKKVEADLTTTKSATPAVPQTFDPNLHISFTPPAKSHTLLELGLSSPLACGPVAITSPFPLFSAEGVRALRADLFRPELLSKHMYRESKTPGIYKIRGYGYDAPFVSAAWKSPEVLAACSKAAGVELEVVFDYEIGHINVQLPPGMDDGTDEVALRNLPLAEPPRQIVSVSEEEKEEASRDTGTLTAWHNDSYPWVCVVMLSDPTGMVGGETALRKADGSILKVQGHQAVGSAVMMQGGLINHVALKAMGAGERITMVTSFRPKNPDAYDGSNLGNVKKVSDHDRLYEQWTRYRVEVLEKRAERFKSSLAGLKADEIHGAVKKWADEQIEYLQHTVREMTDAGCKGNYN